MTEARWRSVFAGGDRWSMRAAMSACTTCRESIRPRSSAAFDDIRIVSSTKSGLPSVRSRSSLGRAGGASRSRPRTGRAASRRAPRFPPRTGAELDRGRPHAPSTPSGPRVEELRARQAEDEERPADPVGQVLDEVEQRLPSAQWMSSNRRTRGCTSAIDSADLAGGPRGLRAALALERLHHPGGERQDIRDRLLGAALAGFSKASSSGSSSEMPAAALTISARASRSRPRRRAGRARRGSSPAGPSSSLARRLLPFRARRRW